MPAHEFTGTVVRVLDGQTVVLTDGNVVRLAGIAVPAAFDVGAQGGAWPPEQRAREVLSKELLGKFVAVGTLTAAPARDRHGRLRGQVFVIGAQQRTWVQGALIRSGAVAAVPEPDAGRCASAALAIEDEARTARRGIFGEDTYRVLDLERDSIAGLEGRYQVIGGRVRRLWWRREGTWVVVDGGRSGTAVGVLANRSAIAQISGPARAGKSLIGQQVEVRGWLERQLPGRGDGVRGVEFIVRVAVAGGIRLVPQPASGSDQTSSIILDRPLIEAGGSLPPQ